jgi:hypothetical protein
LLKCADFDFDLNLTYSIFKENINQIFVGKWDVVLGVDKL